MESKSKFRNAFWWNGLLVILALSLAGCYREAVSEYANKDGISYYRLENGVYKSNNIFPAPVYIKGKYEGILVSVYNKLEYPDEARSNETEGYADIYFRLKPDGTVVESIIRKDLEDGCGEAAAKAVLDGLKGKTFEPTGINFDLYGLLRIYFELP